jgi:hypothetical protein
VTKFDTDVGDGVRHDDDLGWCAGGGKDGRVTKSNLFPGALDDVETRHGDDLDWCADRGGDDDSTVTKSSTDDATDGGDGTRHGDDLDQCAAGGGEDDRVTKTILLPGAPNDDGTGRVDGFGGC